MTSPLRSEKGLGLLQVLFALTAIAISASVVMMDNPATRRSAGPQLTWQRMDTVKAAIDRYRLDGNSGPPNLNALTTSTGTCAPDTNPASVNFRKLRGWCGPYLPRESAGSDLLIRDGWNSILQYNGTTLVSCGPNRVCGDGDDITVTL